MEMRGLLVQELRFGGAAAGAVEDAVADALLEYAAALANSRRSEVVEIPVRVERRDALTRLLLTPGSSLGVVTLGAVDRPVPGSGDAVAELRRRLAALTAPLDLSGLSADDLVLQLDE